MRLAVAVSCLGGGLGAGSAQTAGVAAAGVDGTSSTAAAQAPAGSNAPTLRVTSRETVVDVTVTEIPLAVSRKLAKPAAPVGGQGGS